MYFYINSNHTAMAGIELRRIGEDDVRQLVRFVEEAVEGTGCEGVVIGLSGGLDSVTVAKLCIEALGADKVACVFMPVAATPAEDRETVRSLCSDWGMDYTEADIQPAVDAFARMLPAGCTDPVESGNISARCRMVVLYGIARRKGSLVIGTSNKSELLTGYFTKFGDGSADIRPLADLYKTQVRQLAQCLGVPAAIVDRVPTAGFWEGQTDEGELGMPYGDLDRVLEGLMRSMDDEAISGLTGVPVTGVTDVRERMESTAHKRRQPPYPQIAPGTA